MHAVLICCSPPFFSRSFSFFLSFSLTQDKLQNAIIRFGIFHYQIAVELCVCLICSFVLWFDTEKWLPLAFNHPFCRRNAKFSDFWIESITTIQLNDESLSILWPTKIVWTWIRFTAYLNDLYAANSLFPNSWPKCRSSWFSNDLCAAQSFIAKRFKWCPIYRYRDNFPWTKLHWLKWFFICGMCKRLARKRQTFSYSKGFAEIDLKQNLQFPSPKLL